ncbi:MAG: ABC transporter permease [Firmicutes bacterium]|nr:ABC transporter permease [Bacillota bacterium]
MNRKLFVAPFYVFIILMVGFPLVLLVTHMFSGAGANFSGAFSAGSMAILWRSIWIAALVGVICLVIAYPIAYGLTVAGFKRGKVILLLFILPMWISLMLRAFALQQFFEMIGIGSVGLLPLVLSLVLEFLPLAIIPIYIVMSNVSKTYVEASQDLGASPWQTFRATVFPLALPGAVIGFLFAFIPTLSNYFLASFFGNNETMMIGQQINSLLRMAQPQIGQAAVVSMLLLVVIFTALFITDRLSKIGTKRGGLL